MFEQHPVPQQISSYSFKLVGNMTLKQFFQLAGGAVVALILYGLPITPYVKWPLILLSVISGAAFAFLPIQDRPLEQWLFAFFRSIYSPTIFVWDKNASSFEYFKTDSANIAQAQVQVPEAPQNQPQFVTNIETATDKRLDAISNMMDTSTHQNEMPATTEPGTGGVLIGQNVGQILTSSEDTNNKPQVTNVPKELNIPTLAPVTMEKKGFEVPNQVNSSQLIVEQKPLGEVFNAQNNAAISQAQFSAEAAPPSPPTQANTLVGQVMDANSKIVEGAILEIKDNMGRPVRALKTNRVGHFMVVTPLANGEYNIVTEKEGLTFKPVALSLSGNLVEPIAIKATL